MQQAGFTNREELHFADTQALKNSEKKRPDFGFWKQGRWQWDHLPEQYARDNYAECLESLKRGTVYQNTNLPPGHVYKPWTLDSETKRMQAKIPSDLKKNGYWGM